jgi:chloride channel protein, CIC family
MAEQQQTSPRAYLRLVGLGALIGIPAALVAALFLALVHDVEHWLWHDLPDSLGHSSPPWYLVIGLPTVGGALVALVRLLLPGDGGHRPLDGIALGVTPLKDGPGIALAGLASLSFGAVLGPEAPLIALGAVVGLSVTLLLRVSKREEPVLATAGSFSAISALFGGPLVGGMLMVEGGLGMGAALLPIILPGFVAAAVGYLIFVGFGDWGGLEAQGLVVPNLPPYNGTHLADLIVAVLVGILAALVAVAARRAGSVLDARVRGRKEISLLLVLGGLAVGLLAEIADLLGADSQDVLFSGQASVPDLVTANSTKIVFILLAAKAIAYAVSLGCGFRGGPVFPAIFLGIALATFATVWFDVSPTLAVAVGAAAGTAAVTRLLVTSSLFATLLVGTQGVDAVPAAVLAASAAWLVVQAVDRRRAAAGAPDVIG